MNQPNAIFPNETYLNGLREADGAVVEALYNEFRQPVARAVEFAGGSYADGATFFRVALIQTAELVAENKYPFDHSIGLYLKQLAIAQYTSWLFEKKQEIPNLPEPTPEEEAIQKSLPKDADLIEMRLQIRAKRQFTRLEMEDQKQILDLAQTIRIENNVENIHLSDAHQSSLGRYKNLLKESETQWEEPLPTWVVNPLTDQHFDKIWAACEAIEKRLTSSQIPNSGENKTIRNAFITLLILTIGYAAFTWIFRDRSPAEVYNNNFDPPASIVADLELRYAHDSIPQTRPETCTRAFNEADVYYKKREWREAAASLAGMMEDSLSSCQSDALFYLAIVGLQMDRPELSLECISKIEDLERFGEDIYWYMALAYVKIAAQDPSEKETARRAVERALSNTEIPKRREKAEKMLEELAQ